MTKQGTPNEPSHPLNCDVSSLSPKFIHKGKSTHLMTKQWKLRFLRAAPLYSL
jgi:hypothetical protein